LLGEYRQVLLPDDVCLGEKRHRIVEAGYLRGLVHASQGVLGRSVHDGLPNLAAEGLVGVCRSGKLGLHPFPGCFLLLPGLLVYVQCPSVEGVVRTFDLPYAVVVLIELVSTGLVELPEVGLGLLVLVDERS
jgi:hypothetical protein